MAVTIPATENQHRQYGEGAESLNRVAPLCARLLDGGGQQVDVMIEQLQVIRCSLHASN